MKARGVDYVQPPFAPRDLALARKPKCASSFVRGYLREATSRDHQMWGHHTAKVLRRRHPERIIVGVARAPCPWVVSWWADILRSGRPEWLYPFLRPADRNHAAVHIFRAVLYGVTHPEVYQNAPAELRQRGEPVTGQDLSTWTSGGLWSWMSETFNGDADYLIACERANEGLGLLVGKNLSALPRRGVHGPKDPRPFYTDEMLDWVREADGDMMDRLGYDLFGAPDWALRRWK